MDSVPPCDEPCSLPGQSTFPTDSPFHRRKPLPTLPKVFQRPGSKRCREKKKAPKRILSSRLCPSLVSGCSAMLHADQPPDSGGDFRPDLKKSFFRDGESTRGEGAGFTKNASSPLVPPAPQHLPNKKSGAVTCTRFYRKNKRTMMYYFLSPLCLRLWPCCMK